MYLTEEEAKQKWCPFAKVSASTAPETGNHSSNRMGDEPANGSNCYASGCMVWRWAEALNQGAQEHYEMVAPPDVHAVPPKPVGYCGHAGKPED